jgi:glycosyltransferase involved in cell wall biosynthesis
MKQPKVALFYDWLNQWGGAEKVLLDLIKIYPNAPVYTLVYDPKLINWLPKGTKVICSSLDYLPQAQSNSPIYTPFYALALEQFNFSSYDIVISTTSTIGHCLLTQPHTMFVCYFHNINRYIYKTPTQYKILSPILNYYKKIDYIYSQRPDYILCNSKNVKNKIETNYLRLTDVIHPGIDLDSFKPPKDQTTKNYFLIVSRLVSHKKIDLAIKACHATKNKLIIVGTGRDQKKFIELKQKLNDSNIQFLGQVSDKKLLELYQNCLALICPQEEDFGLTPIEAQACGKPIIAFNRGGITETVINGKTGILFEHQTVESLTQAIIQFKKIHLNSEDCIKNAQHYSNRLFMLNFNQKIKKLWSEYQKKITMF